MDSFYNNNICRLCLNSEGTIYIFNKINTSAIAEKVMFCTRIKIKNTDNLPKMVCKFCVKQLNAAYQFRVQVINSDYKLRNAIKDLENLNDSEMFSTELLEISLLTPEENKSVVVIASADESCKNKVVSEEKAEEPCKSFNLSIENDNKQGQHEPRIGIIKLGEDSKFKKTRKTKNHMCEHCGKKFNKSTQLLVHTRIHTKEKPFVCDICEKSFVLSHHLKSHRRIHSSDPQERRPYECKYCHKMFSENCSLTRHIKIHENVKVFMCTVCNRKFITLADARNHLVRHSGLKAYQCPLCDKKYSNPSNLSKHKKKHC